MTTPASTVQGTGTPGPDPAGGPAASAAGDAVVSRAEFEELSRRLSGKDRAFAKRERELLEDNAKLKNQLDSVLQSRPSVELPDLPADSPYTPHIQRLYESSQEWQESLTQKDARERLEARIRDAVQDAVKDGVPIDEIDDSSPEAVERSAREWLKDKQVKDLQDQVAKLTQSNAQAETRVREEMGATVVSTNTGGSAPQSSVDEQIAAVLAERDQFKRANNMNLVVRANSALAKLQAWKKTGQTKPMPLDWNP